MRYLAAGACASLLFGMLGLVQAEVWVPYIPPEQRCIAVRGPEDLRRAPVPAIPPPPTITDPSVCPGENLTLDCAIRIALANSEVVRILVGETAVASGQTIYDPAVTNTLIDEEQGRFDPFAEFKYRFNRFETPRGILDDTHPELARIVGTRNDDHEVAAALSKTSVFGGTTSLVYRPFWDWYKGYPGTFPLNPQHSSSLEMGYLQPLLQGGGRAVNLAPVVLARIETERSYFQLKDSVQELIRGVVEAYWALVFARTDAWAKEQQVEQATEAYNRAKAEFDVGRVHGAEVAQTQVALAQFRAALIAAQSNVISREAILRNLMGLPPAGPTQYVPVTPPNDQRYTFDWESLIGLAGQYRPDVIEFKLILDADEQRLLLARNEALPRVDGLALYRWNGLEGETPVDTHRSTDFGEYTDWTLGVNFSVPLGLRAERAKLRRRELLIARDRANLQQAVHQATHLIAEDLRDAAQAFEEYVAYKEMRTAALRNLDQQLAEYRVGRVIFLNVLQAITDWGDSVSFEARALARYNVELANLERNTGTIMESYGVRFFEERFASIGPLGRCAPWVCYPKSLPPSANADRHPVSDQASENFFDLTNPAEKGRDQDDDAAEDPPMPEDAPKRQPGEDAPLPPEGKVGGLFKGLPALLGPRG